MSHRAPLITGYSLFVALLGRMVPERNAGMLESGQHEVALDAAQLPGGTCFVRVRGAAGGVQQMEVTR